MSRYRAGSHRPEGFIVQKAKDIQEGARIGDGHAIDLAPTILTQMGISPPDYMKGHGVNVVPASQVAESI